MPSSRDTKQAHGVGGPISPTSTAMHGIPSALQAPQTPVQGPSTTQTEPPRNVSFANTSDELTAYREHNPPAVLRRQEAARRESSPQARPSFQIGGQPSAHPEASSRLTSPSTSFVGQPMSPLTSSSASNAGPPSAPPGSASAAAPNSAAAYGPATAAHGAPAPHSSSAGEVTEKSEEVHILVAVTGSVATIKLPLIVHKLKQLYRSRAVINVVVTRASTVFFDKNDLPKDVTVWYDTDEWRSRAVSASHREAAAIKADAKSKSESKADAKADVKAESKADAKADAKPDPKAVLQNEISREPHPLSTTTPADQLHIRLRRWADILLVAPCSANTLAKLTYGICDNLLTSIFRVWNPEVPVLLAPAMNTHMYTNPVTKRHFNIIKEYYPFVEILKPVEKVLVCGDIGMGGMREWNDIVQVLVKRVGVVLEDEDEDDED